MKYYTKVKFTELAKVSGSTVDRFYKEYPSLGDEREKVGKRKDIPETHLKYFDLGLMIKEHADNLELIRNLKKVIALSSDTTTLGHTLWHMNWEYFGTISYGYDYTRDTCYNKMSKLFGQLKDELSDPELKIFFTTESYSVREGNHNHFVINCNAHSIERMKNFINDYSKRHRVDLEKYNPEEAGIFYIAKEGLQGTDWDYLK